MGVSFPPRSQKCIIPASGSPDIDDSPAIIKAFSHCSQDSHIIFQNTTYHISRIMNTTSLQNVSIEILGTLLWDTNITYWLANSMPIGFQNQTAAWHLGGTNLHIFGHGYGTLNGNGQVWYDFAKGVSNIHGRPHQLLITNTVNSVIEGLRFLQSQMWTMTIARSERVLLRDIYVNSTSTNPDVRSNVNTDGADTVYANNITFLRWEVINGDDSISMKQNSTNIYISNCTFYNGASLAMGSIGQYPNQIEVIENITAVDIKCIGTGYAGRIKTWVGENSGYPPNGGGGGIGWAKNITFENIELERVGTAWLITQCTFYDGPENAGGGGTSSDPNCSSSRFQVCLFFFFSILLLFCSVLADAFDQLLQISDLYWGNIHGTLNGNRVAALQCSAEAPCQGVNIFNNSLIGLDGGEVSGEYLCEEVEGITGFECTGACDGNCPRSVSS